MIDFKSLLSQFRAVNDKETETAYFWTHVPFVAPLAYLNIIFKPASVEALRNLDETLKIPEPWSAFLKVWNGAILFSGSFNIYGVVAPLEIQKRKDTFSRLPFDIEAENINWPSPAPDRFLVIGSYGFDGSIVCLDRSGGRVTAFQRNTFRSLASWENAEQWIEKEIHRLAFLFDQKGKRLVSEEETLPISSASA